MVGYKDRGQSAGAGAGCKDRGACVVAGYKDRGACAGTEAA